MKFIEFTGAIFKFIQIYEMKGVQRFAKQFDIAYGNDSFFVNFYEWFRDYFDHMMQKLRWKKLHHVLLIIDPQFFSSNLV